MAIFPVFILLETNSCPILEMDVKKSDLSWDGYWKNETEG